MRLWGLFAVLAAACYSAPSSRPKCEITCEASCPGDLRCDNGFCVAPGQVCKPTFAHVAAGTAFACALDDQTSLWCWGSNLHHVIDAGTQLAYTLATRIDHGNAWTALDAGGDQVCGIADGQLYCWGGNAKSEAGAGSADVTAPTPISVAGGPAAWTAVSAGVGFTCAIGDGGLWCWGENSYGQLGTGDTTSATMPTSVGTGSTWAAVSAGEYHTCAITTAGELWCWGDCSYGECGPNTTSSAQTTPIATGVTATAVATASEATCFVTTGGMLECMGGNYYGELGEATTTTMTGTPVSASKLAGWTSLAASERGFCGLTGSDVYCWGTSYFGGMGRGYWSDGPSVTSPAIFKVASGASEVDVGWNYDLDPATNTNLVDLDLACSVIGGEIECWGDNRFGQLGQGNATMATTPAEVDGNHRFTALELGADHGCGVENGGLLCWGSTEYGAATGTYYGNSSSKKPCVAGATADAKLCDVSAPRAIALVPASDAVATGLDHTCSLHNSILTCWGDNASGELGSSNPAAPTARPVNGPGGVGWQTLLDPGRNGQCAIPASGGTYCWGEELTTITMPTHETALDNARAFVLGGTTLFACALDSAGMLSCQGDNSHGQFGDGTQNNQTALTALGRTYAALAAYGRGDTVCALAGGDAHVDCWGDNARGQTGASDVTKPTLTPNTVTGLAGCTAIAVGAQHACALCAGAVSCWGDNRYGQLGASTTSAMVGPTPTAVDLPSLAGDAWTSLVASGTSTCARSQAGVVYCWGTSFHGGLGNGATSANLPVTVAAQPVL